MDNPYYLIWYLGEWVITQVYDFQIVPTALPINIWDIYQITEKSVLLVRFSNIDLVEVGEDYRKFVK